MSVNYSHIKKILLIGGGDILAQSAEYLKESTNLDVTVVTTDRYLEEDINDGTLETFLAERNIDFVKTEDINSDENVFGQITSETLGIAMGSWEFEKENVAKFAEGCLLDFMTIDLPRYKGGAHHTWRLLHANSSGSVNLQLIHGGKDTFQKGEIIKRMEFAVPNDLKIPEQTIEFAVSHEIVFFKEFFGEVQEGKSFEPTTLDENKSSYYPFLHTKTQGLIDWSWTGEQIARFIRAFDDPYPGASTFTRGQMVSMKSVELLEAEDGYHPFTSGIVVRKDNDALYIAAVGNLLKIKKVLNDEGEDIKEQIELGQRFFTSRDKLDAAMEFEAVYGSKGLKK